MAVDHLILDLLRIHRSTQGVDNDGLQLIAAQTELDHVTSGQVLQHAGEPIDELLLIVSGTLKLALPATEGQQQFIQHLRRGDQFGLLAIQQPVNSPVDLIAEHDSRVLRISSSNVQALAAEIPMWKRNLIESLGGGLRNSLAGNRPRAKTKLVAFIRSSPELQSIVGATCQSLQELNESITIFTDHESAWNGLPGSVQSILNQRGETKSFEEIRHQMAESMESARLILDIDVARAKQYFPEINTLFDRVCWLVRPDEVDSVLSLIRNTGMSASQYSEKQRCVWCLDEDEPVAPICPDLSGRVERELKVHLPDKKTSVSPLQRNGIARLVHDLRNVHFSVALGGGAARGMAHLGVLQSLEDAGITVDSVYGTSAGALVGIIYAAGIPPEDIARYFEKDLTPSKIEQNIPGGDSLYLLRQYRSQGWNEMLRKYLHDWKLEQLPIPVGSVAVDLISGEQITNSRGDAVQAILDSINLPGLSAPICRDGMALVDGGIINNVPADVSINLGADFVLAVDVNARLPSQFAGNSPETSTEEMQIPNIFETIVRAMLVQKKAMRAVGSEPADFKITPDVSQFEASDFHHAVSIAGYGREATEAVILELKNQLRELDCCLAPLS